LHHDGGEVLQTVRAALCFRVDTTTVSALTIRPRNMPKFVELTISLAPACLHHTEIADITAYEVPIQWDY
jgi:hypothetical protein